MPGTPGVVQPRGRGWKKNVVPPRRMFASHPAFASTTILATVDLVKFTAPMMDQGSIGSCTGHATSDAIFTSFARAGKPLSFVPSPRRIYGLGRAVTRSHQGLDPNFYPLQDEGAYPSDVMEAIERWGIGKMGPSVDGRFSDCGPSNVNLEADGVELAEGERNLCDEHAVYSVSDILVANSAGFAVPTGFFVDSWFENWHPGLGFVGAVKNPRDPLGGGHYVDEVGYTRMGLIAGATSPELVLPARMLPIGDSAWGAVVAAARTFHAEEPAFFVKNSWSRDWGLNGFFLATRAFFEDVQTGDMHAITATLKESSR